LFEVIETYTKYYLIMEHAAAGELFKRLVSEGRMHESEAKNIFSQIVLAVKHLVNNFFPPSSVRIYNNLLIRIFCPSMFLVLQHDRNIVHRDIKAENVFLSSRGVAKLGDFGFSITVSSIYTEIFTYNIIISNKLNNIRVSITRISSEK